MVRLSTLNERYKKYLEHSIIKEDDGDSIVYFIYLKRPYVIDNNQSVWSEDNLEDIENVLKNYVEENPDWWNEVYGEERP